MANGIKNPDYPSIVGRADLRYDGTVDMSDEGIPIGNGTMGSLIWTSPWSVKLQINRVDVYASSAASESFNIRNNDYSLGCALVDIDFGYTAVFPKSGTKQHLSVYDGMISIEGEGVSLRIVSSQSSDLFAFEIDDRRTVPEPVTVKLRMLRPSEVYEKNHSAVSVCIPADESISLKQEFQEADHFCSSAVSAIATGGTIATRFLNETGKAGYRQSSEKVPGIGISMESEIELSIRPDGANAGKRKVYLSSAASFDPEGDTVAASLDTAKSAMREGFAGVAEKARKWWNDFWAGEYIRLSSEDGKAEHVEYHYHYHLYLMACCGRGSFAPRYGCMLFSTYGDKRAWGAQQWWTNVSLYYRGLYPTGKLELFNGFYNHYTAVRDSCSLAAEQQWGAEGIYYPETMWFDGLAPLPEDIAEEMRDLYLVRKPWEKRSERFRWYAATKLKHNARWNYATVGKWEQGHWIIPEKGVGSFGHVTHMLSPTAQIAYSYWLRYAYTQDREWLKEYAYPMLRGAVEFYRNFPNVRKESDGKYHIYHTNNGEGIWDGHNTLLDISAMRGITPILIRASEILDMDAEMRPVWQEFADNIAPLPTNDLLGPLQAGQLRHWTGSAPPAVHGNLKGPGLVNYYDICTIGTEDEEVVRMGNASFDAIYKEGVNENTSISTLTQIPVAAALLGRASALKYMLPNQIKCLTPDKDFCDWDGVGQVAVLPNRLTLREGPGAIDCQRLGNAAAAMHAALLQSVPPAPGKDPIIYLFPAWPVEWDATYTLAARGAFLVTASIQKGEIGLVKIAAQVGGECRINNPWPGKTLNLYRNNDKAEDLSGTLISFKTEQGEVVTIVPEGTEPPV